MLCWLCVSGGFLEGLTPFDQSSVHLQSRVACMSVCVCVCVCVYKGDTACMWAACDPFMKPATGRLRWLSPLF